MKPKAVIEVRPDKVARVCAWCVDAALANQWCENRGYDITHGVCDACLKVQKHQMDLTRMMEAGRHPLGGSM